MKFLPDFGLHFDGHHDAGEVVTFVGTSRTELKIFIKKVEWNKGTRHYKGTINY
jgi:hypothetical protein